MRRLSATLILGLTLVGCGSSGTSTTVGGVQETTATTGTSSTGGAGTTATTGGTTTTTTTAGGTITTGGTTTGGGSTAAESAGLTELNYVRSLASLAPVTEDTTDASFDPGCQDHAQWIVLNDMLADAETPGTPGYTDAGAQAAAQSNAESSTSADLTITEAIDGLMVAPFHGVGFIDPLLAVSGFGLYNDPSLSASVIRSGAVVNVLGGRTAAEPPASAFPILWPGNGIETPYATYSGDESPDPTTSLSFISQPSAGVGPNVLSAPVYALYDATPNITAFSIVPAGGSPLTVGELDETNYVNPDAATEAEGRDILSARHAVVLMANAPLNPGTSYTASVTNAGVTTTWSFTLTSTARSIKRGVRAFR